MRLGVFARTFDGDKPCGVLSAAVAAGFQTVQYNMICSGLPAMPDDIPDDVALAVRAAAEKAGVEIVAVSGTYNMIHPDLAMRRRGLDRLEALARASGKLSTKVITLCTGTRDLHDQWRAHPDNNGPEAWSDLLASMERAVQIAERHDVFLGVEPELANVVNSAGKAERLIREIGSPRVKIVLDPANLFESASLSEQRRIVAEAIDLLADRIIIGHAKDRDASGRFTAAGGGVLDYPYYLRRLTSVGFDGPLVAHGLAAREAAGVASFLRRTLGEVGEDAT